MEARLDFKRISPDVYQAMLGLEKTVNTSGLEASLLDLVRLKASQINGCAQCIDMHSKDLRAKDESEQRLYLLDAWREAPFYTERERAALAWTEAVTLIADGHAPGEEGSSKATAAESAFRLLPGRSHAVNNARR